MGAICSAGSQNIAAHNQITAGPGALVSELEQVQVRAQHQPLGEDFSQSLYQKLPSTLESVPATPLLTVHTHRPTSQSAVLWLVRGEMRKPVIMNLLSRKVPGLILHLLLGTEMRHSYASQTLTAHI